MGGREERVERGDRSNWKKERARREIGWEGRVAKGREESGKGSEIGWEKDERGERLEGREEHGERVKRGQRMKRKKTMERLVYFDDQIRPCQS